MLEHDIINRESYLYRLDPRAKIIAAFTFSLLVALLNRWLPLVLSLFFGSCAFYVSGLQLNVLARRLIPANVFLLFLWLLLPFSVEGAILFRIGPLTATWEGMAYAMRITMKSNAIMMVLIVLVSATSVLDLGNALSGLKVPEKIVQLLFFTYRYIHVLYMEYNRLTSALKVRVFQPNTDFHTYKTYAYLVGMLLVRSSSRAERVYNAMLCRGFTGKFYSLNTFSLTAKDRYFLLLNFALLALLGTLEWMTRTGL